MANRAAGKGYENEDNYSNIRFQFVGKWEILEPKAHSKGSNFHLLQDMGRFPLVRSKQG